MPRLRIIPSTPLFRRLRLLRRLRFLAPAAALFVIGGCTYKSEIRQGNDTLPQKIESLQPGMTRDEVRALLGANRAPAVFAGDEWIYYYRHRAAGFFPKTKTWGVALSFDGELLSEIRPLSGAEDAETEE